MERPNLECAVTKVHSYVVGVRSGPKRLDPRFATGCCVPTNRISSGFLKVDGELPRRVLDAELGPRIADTKHSKRADNRNNCDRHDQLHDRESLLFRCLATVAFHFASTSESTHVAEDKLRPCRVSVATPMPILNSHEFGPFRVKVFPASSWTYR